MQPARAVTEGWIETARAVAQGRIDPPPGWDVLRGVRPAVLDEQGVRGLVAPLVAAIAWTGAVLREVIASSPFDPLALSMRVLAWAMTVRALLLASALFERLAAWATASRSALVMAPQGLLASLGGREHTADRQDIVAVAERGAWQTRSAGRRFNPVYVVLASPSCTHLELPPIFEETPGVLAERLMRWRGPIEAREPPVRSGPARLPSEVYDDAARGIREPSTVVVRHGLGWLRRGPWASALLGVAIADGVLRDPSEARVTGSLLVLAVAAFLVPAAWIWAQRRSMAPQRGLAMVLTAEALWMRTRAGVLRVPWTDIRRTSIETRGRLSVVEGWAVHRALRIERKRGPSIDYDEAYLGIPAEVALELIEAHARGADQSRGGLTSSAPS